MMSRKKSWELTAIFLVSTCLTIALAGLGGRLVQATAASAQEPYPNLYAGVEDTAAPPEPGKVVYLTFDDGPSPNTERILDILLEKGAKATFFVSGQNADEDYYPVLLNRMVDEGHTIGLHTYTHRFDQIYKSVDTYMADLDKLNSYIMEVTGYRPSIVRYPGGSRTINAPSKVREGIAEELGRRGYQYYDWDVVSGDDTSTVYPADYLAKRIIDGIGERDSAIALFHDSQLPVTTPDAARLIIEELEPKGYRFDRLTAAVEVVHIQ